jgi:hypothetical protein
MRAIVKPTVPDVANKTSVGYAIALGNAVGRCCSFCEKALTLRLRLFHKQRGVLADNAVLAATDWGDLLLICGDCAAMVGTYDPQKSYFWPDSDVAQQAPYIYSLYRNVTINNLNFDGDPLNQTTEAAVLISLATDIDGPTTTAAINTAELFQLNGAYFNSDFSSPAYTFPYAEYMQSSDLRRFGRLDVWERGVEAGEALAAALAVRRLGKRYILDWAASIDITMQSFGFQSTWNAAIATTMNAKDNTLLPELFSILSGQPVEPSPSRKRSAQELDESFEQATDQAQEKYRRLEDNLNQIISVKS